MRNASIGLALLGVLLLGACEDNVSPDPSRPVMPSLRATAAGHPLLNAANRRLAAKGLKFRVPYAEYYTLGKSGQVGQVIFAKDVGNKHIGADYVPGLTRPSGATDHILYLVDRSDGATGTAPTLTNVQTEGAIDRAMTSWEDVRCSKLAIDKVPDTGADPDVFDGLIGFGGIGTPFADITHAGWYPGAFFDAIVPGGSQFILGVTIPFVFTDDAGNFTDLDGNGELDYAFAEIYYNDAFPYGINTDFPIDVESVALHEAGHGLSQDHFGKIFRTVANGKLHFAPLAVMNAAYAFAMQDLLGSDIAGHCSLWANWPRH